MFFDTSLMLLYAHHTEITVVFGWVLKINSVIVYAHLLHAFEYYMLTSSVHLHVCTFIFLAGGRAEAFGRGDAEAP